MVDYNFNRTDSLCRAVKCRHYGTESFILADKPNLPYHTYIIVEPNLT